MSGTYNVHGKTEAPKTYRIGLATTTNLQVVLAYAVRNGIQHISDLIVEDEQLNTKKDEQ